jgi:hypothetical protein
MVEIAAFGAFAVLVGSVLGLLRERRLRRRELGLWRRERMRWPRVLGR